MMRKGWLLFITAIFLSGCVWSKDYKSRLAEIDGLQKEKAGVEVRLKTTEEELAKTKQERDELAKAKAALEQENANLKSTLETKKDQLTKEVVDLKNQVSDNKQRIKGLDDELAARNRKIGELEKQADLLSKEKAAAIEEKEKAIASVKDTYDSLVSELKQEIKQGEIQITQLKDKLTVNMVEKILFDSGSAVIKKNGKKVLDRVADILKGVKGQQIKVEGHTDNVPIGASIIEKFPTNWELSTARATTVVRYLQERGIDPKLLSAEGYSEYQPVAQNDNDENRAKNRRIEIVLLPLHQEGR